MHADGFDIDLGLVRRLIMAHAGRFAELELRPAPSGTDNLMFRLGPDLVVRLPRHPRAIANTLKEQRWLPRFAGALPVAVPEIVEAFAPTVEFGAPWMILRWLPGVVALDRPDEVSGTRLAEAVWALRNVSTVGAPPRGSAGFERGGPLSDRADQMDEALAQSAHLFDVAAVRAVWRAGLEADAHSDADVWVHTDMIGPNLLLQDGILAAILDFGCMSVGDPAYDLTPAWFVLSARERDAFLEYLAPNRAELARARALVVSQAAIAWPYYEHTDAVMCQNAARGIDAILSDLRRNG